MNAIHKTIGACFTQTAEQAPEKEFVKYEKVSYTYAELDFLSDCMAWRMGALGITKGTHAGLWSVNNPNWIIVFLALTKIGAIPVIINTCYLEKELLEVINYADVEYMYYGDGYKNVNYLDIIDNIQGSGATKVKKWMHIGIDNKGAWITRESFVSAEKTEKSRLLIKELLNEVSPGQIACMLFTSGTTSSPKGVLLTHENIVGTAYATIKSMRWTKDMKMCVTVPLFHCFGLTSCLITTLLLGSIMYVLPYYNTINVLRCIQKEHCTVLNGVPSMFLAMIRNRDFKEYDLSSLQSGIIAGSFLSPEAYINICNNIPSITLIPSYGQTESSPAVTFSPFDDSLEKKSQNVGKPLVGVEVIIVDPTSNSIMPVGHSGEIMVRGSNVMKGYYKLTDATKVAINNEGFLHTGDLGYLDSEGYLHMVGRAKEIIIRAGENISPHEIEDTIKEIPWVEGVVVVGLPCPVIQEEIAACMTIEKGHKLNEDYIRQYLGKRLAHYKIPAKFLVFDELPVSASGKYLLSDIKEMAKERKKHLQLN
jgi:fatty-acyl-CoA synthase